MSASACHIGGPIYVNPGELALVYGTLEETPLLQFIGTIRLLLKNFGKIVSEVALIWAGLLLMVQFEIMCAMPIDGRRE